MESRWLLLSLFKNNIDEVLFWFFELNSGDFAREALMGGEFNTRSASSICANGRIC